MACSGSGGGGGALSSRRGQSLPYLEGAKDSRRRVLRGVCCRVGVLRQVMGVLREPLCPSVRVGVAQKEENRIPA